MSIFIYGKLYVFRVMFLTLKWNFWVAKCKLLTPFMFQIFSATLFFSLSFSSTLIMSLRLKKKLKPEMRTYESFFFCQLQVRTNQANLH